MARSLHGPLAAMLREAHAASTESAATGVPIDEVSAMRAERALEARAATARPPPEPALAAQGRRRRRCRCRDGRPARSRRRSRRAQPRIAIVGGGVAGLRCAHRLWTKWKKPSTIYEWDTRVGGRVDTLRGYFANNQIVEQHGEFISSEHVKTLGLASSLGLSLDLASTSAAYPAGTLDTYWLNGARYTQAMLDADWQAYAWATFNDAVRQAPWPTRYTGFTQAGYDWDHLSVVDWIEQHVPGGLGSTFGKLCYYVVISEFGGPPEQQSALNLVYILVVRRQPKRPGVPVVDDALALRHGREVAHPRRERPARQRHGRPAPGRHDQDRAPARRRQGQRQPDLHPDVLGRGVDASRSSPTTWCWPCRSRPSARST